MDNEQLVRRAETHSRLRRILLVANALTYVAWLAAQGLEHAQAFGLSPATWSMLKSFTMVAWVISLTILCAQISHLRRHRALGALVDDERQLQTKAVAFQTGYWVLLVIVAALYLVSFFDVDVDVRTVLPFLLAAGVAVPGLTIAFRGG